MRGGIRVMSQEYNQELPRSAEEGLGCAKGRGGGEEGACVLKEIWVEDPTRTPTIEPLY